MEDLKFTVAFTAKVAQPHTIVSAEVNANGKLEIVRKYPSNMILMSQPPQPAPDRIVKEIYSAVHGVIVLTKIIEGRHTPAHQVPELIEFPEAHAKAAAGDIVPDEVAA